MGLTTETEQIRLALGLVMAVDICEVSPPGPGRFDLIADYVDDSDPNALVLGLTMLARGALKACAELRGDSYETLRAELCLKQAQK